MLNPETGPQFGTSKKEQEEEEPGTEKMERIEVRDYENLSPEEQELLEDAVKNLKGHGIPVEDPKDVRMFEGSRKGWSHTKGGYDPIPDRLMVYKGAVKEAVIHDHLREMISKEKEDKGKEDEEVKKEAHKELKNLKLTMEMSTITDDEEKKPPQELIEKNKEGSRFRLV